MNESLYIKHYPYIVDIIKTQDIDTVDQYLKQELRDLTKKVIEIREKIFNMKNAVKTETNSDELTHLQYDIEDANGILSDLIEKLKTADERYLCFKEYLSKHNQSIE